MKLSLVLVTILVTACGTPKRAALDDAGGGADDAQSTQPGAASDAGSAMVDAAPPRPARDPFAALAALPPVCSGDGWCWYKPSPSGESYNRIVASAPDNIWLVGGGPPSYAAILSWNGQTWTSHKPPVPAGYPEYLFPMAISTSGPTNTWMVYSNLVEHWDGATWTIVDTLASATLTLNGVWVDPTGDAWVTRSDGVIKRWHGGQATVIAAGVYAGSIWGTAPDDVFVTTIGAVLHYDGTRFTTVYSGGKTAGWYQGVTGDVWISGDNGSILHWDGEAVTELTAPGLAPRAVVQSAQFAAHDDVSWLASGGTAAPGTLVHWDGAALSTTPVPTVYTPLGDNVCSMLGSARVIDGKWWIVCSDGVVATLTGAATLQPVIAPWYGSGTVWGTSEDDMYLATGGGLHHYDGTAWTHLQMPISGLRGIAGGGAGGANELFGTHAQFAAGMYTTYLDHFDGAAWTSTKLTVYPIGQALKFISSVYPLGHDEAFIVGGAGTAFHYQAGALTPVDAGTTADLNGVWGPDADHLTIVGTGAVLTWDRAKPGVLSPDPSLVTTDDLRAIASSGMTTWILPANRAYMWRKPAFGSWETVATQFAGLAMTAISDTNVVVTTTTAGQLARWNGTAFVFESYPSWRGLFNLFALPDGTTYVSGSSGIVVHR